MSHNPSAHIYLRHSPVRSEGHASANLSPWTAECKSDVGRFGVEMTEITWYITFSCLVTFIDGMLCFQLKASITNCISYRFHSFMLPFVHLQNRILWVDEKNLTARMEAGIVGQDLERLVSTAHPPVFIHRTSLY